LYYHQIVIIRPFNVNGIKAAECFTRKKSYGILLNQTRFFLFASVCLCLSADRVDRDRQVRKQDYAKNTYSR
jgi:hypothetical protein